MNENNRKLGYARLSKNDDGSYSIPNQIKDLKALDPNITIFVDDGVSGGSNLTDPKASWAKLWAEFMLDPSNTTICAVAGDRISREWTDAIPTISNIMKLGGELFILHDNKTYCTANDSMAQDLELLFSTFTSTQYRKDIIRKTQRALDELKGAGVKLGKPPKFRDADVAKMKELHARGIGYASIGKIVRRPDKKSEPGKEPKLRNTDPHLVKKIVSGEYVSYEQWERKNQIARLKMLDA